MVTYSSPNTTTSWYEPCWCCGTSCLVTDCDPEAGCYELLYECEVCEVYGIADYIEHLWGADGKPAGISTRAESQFDPATSWRMCPKHGKSEGRDPN